MLSEPGESPIQALERLVEERTQEIERKRQVAEALRGILTILNSELPLEDVLDYIAAQAVRILMADAVAIYRLLEDDSVLIVQSMRGLDQDYVRQAIIPVGLAATGLAVQKRRPVNIPDVRAQDDPRNIPLDDARRELIFQLGRRFRGVLSVPLVIKNDVYGAITLYYREPHQVQEDELELAVTFSDQAALAIENARLRAQIEHDAAAAERNRLARELHDSVSQTIFSASIIAEVLPMVWKRSPADGEQGLDELRQLTRGALAEMRTLLLELRPTALTEANLDDLLRQLTQAVSGRVRFPIQFERQGRANLPAEVRVAFYRIAQEALNNMVRHANADHASVTLTCTPEVENGFTGSSVFMEIEDDGCGFSVSAADNSRLGLGIMNERAHSIGADLTIKSQTGCGTKISVHWHEGGRRP